MSAPVGVLWTNLGSPAAPTPRAVRRYLRQFLTDPRVVDLNPWLWRALLELAILPRRGRSSAEAYAKVWTRDGAPLVANSRRQSERLAQELGPGFRVATAMRYGEPSIASATAELLAAGCRQLVLLPAFPQYAGATTGSALAEAQRVLAAHPGLPPLAVVDAYPDDPGYLDALAAVARRATAGRAIDGWVLSFHGIPVRIARSGDPYPVQCAATARGLADRLGLAEGAWTLTWQSRFGREPWLEPATDAFVLTRAPAAPNLAVVLPGFTADCLETLEEIGMRLRADFRAAGGGELVVVPALNDEPAFVRALARLVRRKVEPGTGAQAGAGGGVVAVSGLEPPTHGL